MEGGEGGGEEGDGGGGGVEVGWWRGGVIGLLLLPGVLFTQTHTSSLLPRRCRRRGEK